MFASVSLLRTGIVSIFVLLACALLVPQTMHAQFLTGNQTNLESATRAELITMVRTLFGQLLSDNQSLTAASDTNAAATTAQNASVGPVISVGNLSWQPGATVLQEDIIDAPSDPARISHTIRSRDVDDSNRSFTLGLNEDGGGYAWSMVLDGFADVADGTEVGIPGYGKGLAGSVRDRMHSNTYNPEQAGKNDYEGNAAVVETQGNSATIPQYQLPLYSDGSWGDNPVFEFSEHDSEFDYSQKITNGAGTYGTPAFVMNDYYVYARTPDAIEQFTEGTILKGGRAGEPVLHEIQRVADISSVAGEQTPDDTDMSYLVHSLRGLRVHSDFNYLHYRSNGEWVTEQLDIEDTPQLTCKSVQDATRNDYERAENGRTIPKNIGDGCELDVQLMVFSNNADVTEGTAVALYHPLDAGLNRKSTRVYNPETGELIHHEDRIMQSVMSLNGIGTSTLAPDGYFFVAARNYVSGMLAPDRATDVYGEAAAEMLTGQTVVMVGTPEEILAGVATQETVPEGSEDVPDDTEPEDNAHEDGPFDIVVVGGQSNAVGRGLGSYEEQPLFASEAGRIYQWARYGADADSPALVSEQPLQHWGQAPGRNEGRHGFDYPFALRLASQLPEDRNVLVVPVARGGTSILQWDEEVEGFSNGNQPDSTLLYDDMIERVNAAMESHPDNRLAAILWQHGEADITAIGNPNHPVAGYMTDAEMYGEKLATLRDSIRDDVTGGNCAPFLIGEVSRNWEPVNGNQNGADAKIAVTAAAEAVAEDDSCNASVFVKSFRADGNGGDDEIHFSAEGQWEMARNYWGRFQSLNGTVLGVSTDVRMVLDAVLERLYSLQS